MSTSRKREHQGQQHLRFLDTVQYEQYRQNNLLANLELQVEELSRQCVRLQEQNAHLTMELDIDPKTGLPNERAFKRRLTEELGRKQRTIGYHVLLAKFDLDGFKSVNDTYGDQAGDHALKVVGERLTKVVRPYDLVARPYGDTFYMVLGSFPNASEQNDALTSTYRSPEKLLESAKQSVGTPITYQAPGQNEVVFTVGLTGEGSLLQSDDTVDSICARLDTGIGLKKIEKYSRAGLGRRR